MKRLKYVLITVGLAALVIGVVAFLKGPSNNNPAPQQTTDSAPQPSKQLNFKINNQ